MDGGRSRELVGREAELERLLRSAAARERLVCVKGPAGVGKTALARAALSRCGCRGAVCSLEGVETDLSLVTAVAAALGAPLPAVGGVAREETLLRAMSARAPLFLVLDAAERTRPLVEAALERWVPATSDDVTFVVTSQLRLEARVVIELEPLLLPEPVVQTAAQALASPAVRLFVQRASERTGFELADADVPDVVALVRALDGLPLALLLGAARVGLLGVQKTRELLARRFELLVGANDAGVRDGDLERKHRSLEAAIAWSWELLGEEEKTTLAFASVFRGGFTLEAAQAVAGEIDDLTMLARIEALLGASLLVLVAPPAGGQGARFDLYESVREFVRRATAPALLAEAEHRHATFYLEAAERVAARVRTREGVAARRWLAEESANVVAVASAAASQRFGASALRAALALEPLYLARGPVEEHIERVERLLGETALEPVLSARARTSLGLAEIYAGRRTEAVERLEQSLALAEAAGASDVAALAATKAALVLGLTGDAARAGTLFECADRHAKLAADPHLAGIVAKDRGMVLAESGDNARAIAAFEAALVGFRGAGDAREEAFTLAAIGARYLDTGALVESKRHSMSAVAKLDALGDQRTLSWTLLLLAMVLLENGELEDAAAHAARALANVRAVGDRLTEGLVLAVLGHVALEAGHAAEAASHYARATELLEAVSDRRNAAIALGAWASASALLGEHAHAERLLSRANEHALARGRPGDMEALALFGAVLRAAEAEDAAARGDGATAVAKLAAIEALVDRVSGPNSSVHRSDEVRLASRLAHRAKADAEPRIASMREVKLAKHGNGNEPVAEDTSAPLVLAEDGTWFRLPSGEVHKLRGRPVAARLLRVLVDRALEATGVPVPAASLITAGWPGEKILPKAARNRLYVTMTRLRQLGLGELLRNEGDGYFLRPGVRVRLVRERP